jgi:hypothetical protein
MAKTIYTDGDWLTPSRMNLYFGTAAGSGMKCDGVDTNGSLPKVLLTAGQHVQGSLPLTNMVSHVHNGIQRSKIDLAAAAQVQGDLPLANMAEHSAGTVDVKITTTYLSVQQTATFRYFKISDYVILHMEEMLGTSNSTQFQITPVTTWPAALVPTKEQLINIVLHNDTKLTPGLITISTSNSTNWILSMLDANVDYTTTSFASNNTKGISELTFDLYTGA